MRKLLILGLCSSIFGILGCYAQVMRLKSVNANVFETIISDTSIVRLDVRTPDEYKAGHISGAINIDVQNDGFESKVEEKLPKDKVVAVYCRSGRRSKMAANILVEKGYRVVELESGYIDWTASGKQIVR